jgi:hypothetical protein
MLKVMPEFVARTRQSLVHHRRLAQLPFTASDVLTLTVT